jgi:hypothetical protein
MSLFFDAAWFDARLRQRGIDRAWLASAAGLDEAGLREIFEHTRAPRASELEAFSIALDADILEVTLRAGFASHAGQSGVANAGARIESIEARLDAIDAWIEDFEREHRRRA